MEGMSILWSAAPDPGLAHTRAAAARPGRSSSRQPSGSISLRRSRSPYASIVTADWMTATGSRWVNATVASGKVRISGPSCSQCCGDLSTHCGAPAGSQRLENRAHIGVVLVLVQPEVEVAPLRHPAMPLQHIAREVEVEDLDLLLDRLGEPVVHRLDQRGHHLCTLVLGDTSREPGSTPLTSGPSPRSGKGSWLSQYGKARRRLSDAIKLTRCVVPERGRPTTMIGCSISMSRISG